VFWAAKRWQEGDRFWGEGRRYVIYIYLYRESRRSKGGATNPRMLHTFSVRVDTGCRLRVRARRCVAVPHPLPPPTSRLVGGSEQLCAGAGCPVSVCRRVASQLHVCFCEGSRYGSRASRSALEGHLYPTVPPPAVALGCLALSSSAL
jgi:hypothetical protein